LSASLAQIGATLGSQPAVLDELLRATLPLRARGYINACLPRGPDYGPGNSNCVERQLLKLTREFAARICNLCDAGKSCGHDSSMALIAT